MSQPTIETDVLVCGGGPVGLLTAYCLSRYGVSTMLVEQHMPSRKVQYGRAVMIMPRTLELLDQLDLADALGQIGFVCRGQKTFKNGESLELGAAISPTSDSTYFDYVLMCRQRWTEQVIADAYIRLAQTNLQYGTKLLDVEVTKQSNDDHVLSTIEDREGRKLQVGSRYIIGADGGHSLVRKLAGIAFEGEGSNRRWIRIDGKIDTNMPEARYGLTSIVSATYGSMFWACLDHHATRIGFALPEDRLPVGREITQDHIIQEAKEALKPFSLDFKTVDWWTVYSIGQRLAENYRVRERIFIAGDAAHTHSSGAAQGLNTGLHDAINLAWKIAGTIKGQFSDCVLGSYNKERRAIAEQLIAQDKIISLLTEGKIPEEMEKDPEKDAHKLLFRFFAKNQAFNAGLDISYPEDGLTVVGSTVALKVKVGERAPDILVQRPGTRIPMRLYCQIKHYGKFAVVAFCGNTSKTKSLVERWRQYLDSGASLMNYGAENMDLVTILINENRSGAAEENLGSLRFGQVFYDVDESGHERYGVADDEGAVLVLRPDGHLGTACGLDEGHVVSAYLSRFMAARKSRGPTDQPKGFNCEETKGEVVID